MATMVLERDHILMSTKGYSIRFEKGVPINVPKQIEAEALAIGAVKLDDGAPTPLPDTTMTQEEREEAIDTAIRRIVGRNNSEDFKGTGVPTQAAVSREAKFVVSPKEVEDGWEYYLQEEKRKKDEAQAAKPKGK